MKTLDQWLEDSDEEEEEEDDNDNEKDVRQESGVTDARNGSEDCGSSSSRVVSATRTSGAPSLAGSHVSAHTPNTLRPTEHPPGGLYAQQEETREKMRRLLGADAVVKAVTPPASSTAASVIGSPTWPISAPPSRTNFPFGAAPTTTQPATQGIWAPPTLGRATDGAGAAGGGVGTPFGPNRTDTATDSSQLPEVEQTMTGFNYGAGGGAAGPAYAAVSVLVVDRGTQTVTSEGTQTEPMPITLGPYYTGPMMPTPMSCGAGGGGRWSAPSYGVCPPSLGLGVDGRPYRQYLYDYEKKEAEEASRLREELGMIQNSIDMLIARYNLPPPPM